MNNQCKFKEGDKVKKINGTAFSNGEFVAIVEGEDKYGKIWLKETQSWLDKDSLCLVQPFTKSDIKDGMVVTYRDGDERLVLDGRLYYSNSDGSMLQHRTYLCTFKSDLTAPSSSDMDIMKVTYRDEILWEREEETEEDRKLKEFTNWFYKIAEEHRLSGLSFDMGKVRSIKEELNKLL